MRPLRRAAAVLAMALAATLATVGCGDETNPGPGNRCALSQQGLPSGTALVTVKVMVVPPRFGEDTHYSPGTRWIDVNGSPQKGSNDLIVVDLEKSKPVGENLYWSFGPGVTSRDALVSLKTGEPIHVGPDKFEYHAESSNPMTDIVICGTMAVT